MRYTVRAFAEGRHDILDEMCRTFCSMERTAYNLLREDAGAGAVKATLRERYGIMNARWVQSAMNQAAAVMESQERGIQYRIEQCREKARNAREKLKRLSNPLKIQGCQTRMEKYESRMKILRQQLAEKSYPMATFGSGRLLRQMSTAGGKRKEELKEGWRERRSNHLFSVGQANQRGNANARSSFSNQRDAFLMEMRNWA